MTDSIVWSAEQFPIVYEGGEAKAVIVDFDSFKKIEMILDNLLHRGAEPEDELIVAAAASLLAAARDDEPEVDWREKLDRI